MNCRQNGSQNTFVEDDSDLVKPANGDVASWLGSIFIVDSR